MTYELAKKLKDAGWNKVTVACYRDLEDGKTVNIPTLSELIEACGKERYLQISYLPRTDEWQAHWGFSVNMGEKSVTNCKTPEEAVALLWLELNKK